MLTLTVKVCIHIWLHMHTGANLQTTLSWEHVFCWKAGGLNRESFHQPEIVGWMARVQKDEV